MRLIDPSVEYLPQAPGIEGIYKQIELVGRTCYKSEDKITADSAEPFVNRLMKSQHCYTGNSKVLTEEGWIPWSSYNGEKVATVNLDGSFKGFEKPLRVVKHSYKGAFYYYPSLGIEVTEGHRMYGVFRESKNNFYNNNSYKTFICGEDYIDNNGRKKTIGERMFKTPRHCIKPLATNPYFELIGFWLGDGCHEACTSNKLVFHLKKERKIEYLKTLCKELNYKIEIGKNNYYRVCASKIGCIFNYFFYKNGNKFIPPMCKSDDSLAIKSIICGLINSDGYTGGSSTNTITFTSTSKEVIDWINNVACIGGFSTSYLGVCHVGENQRPVYKILILCRDYIINNDSRNPDSKVIITNKTENVYCVTVSTGLIIVKGDNDVTSICGNCAMLEHGTVYLEAPIDSKDLKLAVIRHSPYTMTTYSVEDKIIYITTNLRVLVENAALDLLDTYLSNATDNHPKRITLKFITDIGVSREGNRHRRFSIAEQSTRYCNYSKDKFGKEITFIKPSWYAEWNDDSVYAYANMLEEAENHYMYLLDKGWKPQQAREVLPLSTATEVVYTAFEEDWHHFFDLRYRGTTGAPHPNMLQVATMAHDVILKKLGKDL